MTAVEWLLNELSIEGYFPCGIIPEIEEQAKEMHSEELKSAYLRGIANYDPTFPKQTIKQQEQ